MSDLNSTIIQESEPVVNPQVKIDWDLYQPWTIWLAYPDLTSWDHDIIKRILRTKKGEPREWDYEKIIHDCEERLRQLKEKRNEN